MKASLAARDLRAFAIAMIGGAFAMAFAGWAQMHSEAQAYGVICGSSAIPHCSACYVAAALLAVGVASLALAHTAARRLADGRVSWIRPAWSRLRSDGIRSPL